MYIVITVAVLKTALTEAKRLAELTSQFSKSHMGLQQPLTKKETSPSQDKARLSPYALQMRQYSRMPSHTRDS